MLFPVLQRLRQLVCKREREDKKMVKFYVNRIKNGGMTLEEVPSLWKAKVEAELLKTE